MGNSSIEPSDHERNKKNSVRPFVYGLSALILGLIGQVLLSHDSIPLAGLCYVLALGLLVVSFRKLPGPEIPDTSIALQLPEIWQGRSMKRLRFMLAILRTPKIKNTQVFNPTTYFHGVILQSPPLVRRVFQNNLLWGAAALPVGILGQFFLAENQLVGAGLAFGLGALLMIFAFRKQTSPDPVGNADDPGPLSLSRGPSRTDGYYLIAGSVVCALLAFWLFNTPLPVLIPWLFFLGSMALLILAVYRLDGNNRPKDEPQSPWTRVEGGIFLAILGVAAFLRLYRLDSIPYGMFYDEAVNGLEALKIISQPANLPVFLTSTQLPAYFNFLVAISMRLFGVSTASVRLVSVAFGLGTVAAAYFAGRELFNRRMGLVLAFFLAIARWDINWSRIGMHGASVPFFELLTIGLILRALRRKRLMDYVLAGLGLGLGLGFYFALRVFPLVILLFLLVTWITHHSFVRSTWQGWLLLGLAGSIAMVPILQYAVFHPDDFFARTQTTSIFTGKTTQEGWSAVARTTQEHLLMFNYRGDQNGRHNVDGEPMLDPISGALMVLGIGLCLWRIRQPASFLLLAWLLLMLVPGIFSLDFESPQSYRAIGSLPAAYLLAAVPLHALWQEWEKAASKRISLVFHFGVALLLVSAGVINYQLYFERQSVDFNSWVVFSTPETIIGKTMAKMGNQVDYFVSTFYYQTPTIQFLAPDIPDYHILQTNQTLPLQLDGSKGAVFFVDPDRRQFYLQAKKYYPRATLNEIRSPSGQTVLYEIDLRPEDIRAVQGLRVSYFPNSKWDAKPTLVRNETSFSFDWQDGTPVPFPSGVEWKGLLFAHTYGTYKITIHAPGAVELAIDEKPLTLNAEEVKTVQIELAKGNHTFRLRAEVKTGHFELDWTPPSEATKVMPASAFFLPEIGGHGLLGSYFGNDRWQSPPAFTQIDPWIHFYFHQPPLQRPYTVEWVGKIVIARSGSYRFGLESIDESSLYIDEGLIVDDRTTNQYQQGRVDLTRGVHDIRIRFADRTGSTHINLYWMPPGFALEAVPEEVLFPPWAGADELTIPVEQEPPPAPEPTPAPNPPDQTGIPAISAHILWQTGQCGSGSGQFLSPNGLTVDRQGNLWVADTGNSRLVKIDSDGKILGTLGSSGDANGQFRQPFDVAIDPSGGLVVLDSGSQKVLQRFNPAGDFQASLGENLGLYSPRGLAIDREGSLIVADTGGNRLLRISPAGEVVEQWRLELDQANPGQPVGAAVNPDGGIYTVDMVSHKVWKLLPGGKTFNWAAAISGDTLTGSRIALGPNQVIYVSDPEKGRLVLYNLDGQPLGQIGASADAQSIFSRPVGITVGPEGVLYVTDSALCTVSAIKLPGK